MSKKLYTTADLFNTIVNLMKEENTLLDILDYHLQTSSPTPITHYAFDIVGDLQFGANEGIYLMMYLEGNITKKDKEYNRIHIGTFKTLRRDRAALKQMSVLMSDFIWNGYQFVNKNIKDFDHKE